MTHPSSSEEGQRDLHLLWQVPSRSGVVHAALASLATTPNPLL